MKRNVKNFSQFVNESSINNYMFFNSLKNIKDMIDSMIEMDPIEIDQLLNDRDWASNHMSTSNDDITEVFQFILSNLDRTVHEDVRHEGDMWNVYIGKRLVGSFESRKEARAKNDEYKKPKTK